MNNTFVECWRRMTFRLMGDRPLKRYGDVYQFGVFSGDSMRLIAQELCNIDVRVKNFFGFDVFTGMPPEKGEELMNDDWVEGSFNILKHGKKFGIESTNIDDIVKEIERGVEEVFFQNNKPCPNVKIFPGLVEETLTAEALSKYDIMPAMYVDVDFDLYSPSKYGLEFLLKHDIIRRNTVVGYDDWGGKPGYNTFATGESRAHKEVFVDKGVSVNLALASLGYGSARTNIFNNVINTQFYLHKAAVNKPDRPDWEWGDVECIQMVWFIDPTEDVEIMSPDCVLPRNINSLQSTDLII